MFKGEDKNRKEKFWPGIVYLNFTHFNIQIFNIKERIKLEGDRAWNFIIKIKKKVLTSLRLNIIIYLLKSETEKLSSQHTPCSV